MTGQTNGPPTVPQTSDSATVPSEGLVKEKLVVKPQLIAAEEQTADIPDEAPLIIDQDAASLQQEVQIQNPADTDFAVSPCMADNKLKRSKGRGKKVPCLDKEEPKVSTEFTKLTDIPAGFKDPQRPLPSTVKSPAPLHMKALADDTVTSPRRNEAESGEKFSSRGRKIIPKERDGEFTGLGRKGRKHASGIMKEPEAESKVRACRRGSATGAPSAMMTMATSAPVSSVPTRPELNIMSRPKRVRKPLQRGEQEEPRQEEAPTTSAGGDMKQEVREEEGDDDVATRGRRTPRRRAQITQKQRAARADGTMSDSGPGDLDSEERELCIALDEPQDGSKTVEDLNRSRRGRKSKSAKTLDMSPKGRPITETGSTSPRSKSSDSSSSPKGAEYTKPVVKLEKLNIASEGGVKRDERVSRERGGLAAKDLYEWEDEDTEPITVFKHTRKRKSNDHSGFESPRKSTEGPEDQSEARHTAAQSEVPSGVAVEVDRKPVELREVKVPASAASTASLNLDRIINEVASADHKIEVAKMDSPCKVEDIKPGDIKIQKRESIDVPHLPAKLELKKEHQAQAAALAAAAVAVMTNSAECTSVCSDDHPLPETTVVLTPLPASSPPALPALSVTTVSSTITAVNSSLLALQHMDEIIDRVAAGDFERGDAYDYYSKNKKRGLRSSLSHVTPTASGHISVVGQTVLAQHHTSIPAVGVVQPQQLSHQVIQAPTQPMKSPAISAVSTVAGANQMPAVSMAGANQIPTVSMPGANQMPAVSMAGMHPMQSVPASVIQTKVPPAGEKVI